MLWLIAWLCSLELLVFVCLTALGLQPLLITDLDLSSKHSIPVQAVFSGLWDNTQGFVGISLFTYLSLTQASVASLIP